MNLREACVAGAVQRVTHLLHHMLAADVDKYYNGVGARQTALFSAVVAHVYHPDNRPNLQLCINALLKKGAQVTTFATYEADCELDEDCTPAGYVKIHDCEWLLEQVPQRSVAPLRCAVPDFASLQATFNNYERHDQAHLVQAAIHAMKKDYTHDQGRWLEQNLLIVALRAIGLVKPSSVSRLPVCFLCPHKDHTEYGAEVSSLSNILSHFDQSNSKFVRHLRGPHQQLKRKIMVAIRFRRDRYSAGSSNVHSSSAVRNAQCAREIKLFNMRGTILRNSPTQEVGRSRDCWGIVREAKVYEEKLKHFMETWLSPEPEAEPEVEVVHIRPFLPCPIPPGDGSTDPFVTIHCGTIDSGVQCPICYTELHTGFQNGDEVLVLDCGHVFCSSCFHAQLRRGETYNQHFQVRCALCREYSIVWSTFAVEDGMLNLWMEDGKPKQVARSYPLPTKIYTRVLELGQLMYTYFHQCPLLEQAVTKTSTNIAIMSPNAYRETWHKLSRHSHARTRQDEILTRNLDVMQDELKQRTCQAQACIPQFDCILAACIAGHVEEVKRLLLPVALDDVNSVSDLCVPDEPEQIFKFYSVRPSSCSDKNKHGLLLFFALEAFHKAPLSEYKTDVLRCVAICVRSFPSCLKMQCSIGGDDVTIQCYLQRVLQDPACRSTFFTMLESFVDIPWLTKSVCPKTRGEMREGHGQQGQMQRDDNVCSSSNTSSGVRSRADSNMQEQGESGTTTNKKHKPVPKSTKASNRPPVYKNHAAGVTEDGTPWESRLQVRPGSVQMPGRAYPNPDSLVVVRVSLPSRSKGSTCENVRPQAVPMVDHTEHASVHDLGRPSIDINDTQRPLTNNGQPVPREGDHANVQKLKLMHARAMQGCSATHTTRPQPEDQTALAMAYLDKMCSPTWRNRIIQYLFWGGLRKRRLRGKRSGRETSCQESPLTMSRAWVQNYSSQATTGPWAPRWFHGGWVKTSDTYQCKHAPNVWCETDGCNADTETLQIKDLNLFPDIRALAEHMINSPHLCTTLLCLISRPKEFDAFYGRSYKQTRSKRNGVTNATKQSTPSVAAAIFNLLYDNDFPVDLKLLEYLVMQARLYRTMCQDPHSYKFPGHSTWSYIQKIWENHYIRALKRSNVMGSRPTSTRNTMKKGLSSCNLGDGPPTMCLDVGTTYIVQAKRKRRNEDGLGLCLDECDPPTLELVGDESTLCNPSCEEEGVHVGVHEDVQAIQGTAQCKDVETVVTWTEQQVRTTTEHRAHAIRRQRPPLIGPSSLLWSKHGLLLNSVLQSNVEWAAFQWQKLKPVIHSCETQAHWLVLEHSMARKSYNPYPIGCPWRAGVLAAWQANGRRSLHLDMQVDTVVLMQTKDVLHPHQVYGVAGLRYNCHKMLKHAHISQFVLSALQLGITTLVFPAQHDVVSRSTAKGAGGETIDFLLDNICEDSEHNMANESRLMAKHLLHVEADTRGNRAIHISTTTRTCEALDEFKLKVPSLHIPKQYDAVQMEASFSAACLKLSYIMGMPHNDRTRITTPRLAALFSIKAPHPWALPEGVTVALTIISHNGVPVDDLLKNHMDAKNDSRAGFDFTVASSYTGSITIGSDRYTVRVVWLAYTRNSDGLYMDRRVVAHEHLGKPPPAVGGQATRAGLVARSASIPQTISHDTRLLAVAPRHGSSFTVARDSEMQMVVLARTVLQQWYVAGIKRTLASVARCVHEQDSTNRYGQWWPTYQEHTCVRMRNREDEIVLPYVPCFPSRGFDRGADEGCHILEQLALQIQDTSSTKVVQMGQMVTMTLLHSCFDYSAFKLLCEALLQPTKQRAAIVKDQKLFLGKILANFPRILSKAHNDRFCGLINKHVILKEPNRTVYRRRFQSPPLSQIRGMIAEMWGNVDALFSALQTHDVRGFAHELMKINHLGPMVALDATRTMSLAYGWHLGKDAFPTPLGKHLGSMRHTSSILPDAMRTPEGVQTFLSSMRPFGAACSELAWRQIKDEFPLLAMYDRLVAFLFQRSATCLCVEMMSCEYQKVEVGLQYRAASTQSSTPRLRLQKGSWPVSGSKVEKLPENYMQAIRLVVRTQSELPNSQRTDSDLQLLNDAGLHCATVLPTTSFLEPESGRNSPRPAIELQRVKVNIQRFCGM